MNELESRVKYVYPCGMFCQAHFPFGYFTGFLDFLRRRADRLQIITYPDLQWGGDFDSIGRWRRKLTTQQLDEFFEIAGDAMRLLGYAP